MSALAAIAVFPILALVLFGLLKVENMISQSAPLSSDLIPVDPPAVSEIPAE
jgi:hypothetical protein